MVSNTMDKGYNRSSEILLLATESKFDVIGSYYYYTKSVLAAYDGSCCALHYTSSSIIDYDE